MTDTKFMLNQTNYFFEQLQKELTLDSPYYEFYLNVFVYSARNTTFVMQKEYSRKQGFKAWWESEPEKKNYQLFNALRTVVIHERPIRVDHLMAMGSIEATTVEGKGELISEIHFEGFIPQMSVVLSDGAGNEKIIPVEAKRDFVVVSYNEKKDEVYEFPGFIEKATEYLSWISRMVAECESRFM